LKRSWPDVIRQVRTKFSLSQKALSEITKVSQKTVSRWERGEVLPGTIAQRDLIDLLRRPSANLVSGISVGIRNCPAPRALSRIPGLRLLSLSAPAVVKRPSIVDWLDRDLAPIATGILEEILDDSELQRAIALREVACVVSTTDSVLRTLEHNRVGKFQTTITYFEHDGTLYSDAVSVPAPAAAVRGYRPVLIDDLLAQGSGA
jgi:transcriptional regulator with XRE-family HTH domain